MDTKRCTFRSSPPHSTNDGNSINDFIDVSCPKMTRIFRNLVKLQKTRYTSHRMMPSATRFVRCVLRLNYGARSPPAIYLCKESQRGLAVLVLV